MFYFLKDLTKAAVGIVTLPIPIIADVVTLGGALTDQDKPYTGTALENVLKNLDKASK